MEKLLNRWWWIFLEKIRGQGASFLPTGESIREMRRSEMREQCPRRLKARV